MSNPRDPRLRRQPGGGVFAPPVDPLAAAVRLDLAMTEMRAAAATRGPESREEDLAAAVQMGTHEPRLTAEEFAAALAAPDPDDRRRAVEPGPDGEAALERYVQAFVGETRAKVAESPAPPPASPPPAPAAAPEPPAPAFSSERSLTWRSRHDPRSLSFGVRALLAGSAPLTDHVWPVGPVLDQGTEGQCVGCAVVDAANVLELAGHHHDGELLDITDAAAIYKRAQKLDEVPGEAYSGTSVLAGMKAGVESGLFGGYRWAFGTRDVAQAVLQVGPVVVGVPWLSGMYDTGPGGLVQITGDAKGIGHCLAVVGIRLKGPQGQPGPFFVWQNSWGPSYGDGGLGYIHHRDLAALLHGTGEAAIPMPGPQHV